MDSILGCEDAALAHDPEKHALGYDPMGVQRFSLATNAERVCAGIMRKQEAKARRRFNLIPSRFSAGLNPEVATDLSCCATRRSAKSPHVVYGQGALFS
jgi:hypothetical protein